MAQADPSLLKDAFDRSAPEYDEHFTHQAVPILLRELVWRECDKVFPTKGRLLDLGCGTGEDAVYFSQRGLKVTGIDASDQMVKEASRKFRRMRMSKDEAEVSALPLSRLGELAGEPWDAALANFGVINCLTETDLERFAVDLHLKLAPGAPFVCVPMGRAHLLTEVDRLRKGQVGRVLERVRTPSMHVPIQGVEVPVRYWTAKELAGALHPRFVLHRTRAVGMLVPPPHLSNLYRRYRRLFLAAEKLEEKMGHLPLLNELGDHNVLIFKRNP